MNSLHTILASWQPKVLSVLRVMAGLLYLSHGIVKHLSFPMAFPTAIDPFSRLWFSGAIELIGGTLLTLGFGTRWVALICSGHMAFAYFLGHAHRSFFPIQNGGNLAIMYSFVFLYIFFAGAGPWSLDAVLSKRTAASHGSSVAP